MILSCGEALIDMLPRQSTLGEACFAPYAGGAVFNTAIALGRLGAPSSFFSGISLKGYYAANFSFTNYEPYKDLRWFNCNGVLYLIVLLFGVFLFSINIFSVY